MSEVPLYHRRFMATRDKGVTQGYRSPLLLKLTEVPLLLRDVPLSTFVSVGSAESLRRFPAEGPSWEYPSLLFKAHSLVYHSTLGLRVIKKKTKKKYPSLVLGAIPSFLSTFGENCPCFPNDL